MARPETQAQRTAWFSPLRRASQETASSTASQMGTGSLGRLASGNGVRTGRAPEKGQTAERSAESPPPQFGLVTVLVAIVRRAMCSSGCTAGRAPAVFNKYVFIPGTHRSIIECLNRLVAFLSCRQASLVQVELAGAESERGGETPGAGCQLARC